MGEGRQGNVVGGCAMFAQVDVVTAFCPADGSSAFFGRLAKVFLP